MALRECGDISLLCQQRHRPADPGNRSDGNAGARGWRPAASDEEVESAAPWRAAEPLDNFQSRPFLWLLRHPPHCCCAIGQVMHTYLQSNSIEYILLMNNNILFIIVTKTFL